MDIIYRTASKEDLPGILSLYRQLNPDDVLPEISTAEAIWKIIDTNEGFRFFIAEENGKIISCCNCAIIPNLSRRGKSFAVIENVITDTAYRRRGIGKQVMLHAIQFAKTGNCYKVILLSSSKRTEAHEFYRSIGFNGESKKGFEIRFND